MLCSTPAEGRCAVCWAAAAGLDAESAWGGQPIMGPSKAELLERIRATGSIAAAGRQMRTSYKRAWMLVETMNTTFPGPLVEAAKSGTSGGQAVLTPSDERRMHDASKRTAHAARHLQAGPRTEASSRV